MRILSQLGTLRLLGMLTSVALVIILTLQNTESLNIDVLFWDLETSRAIFLFLALAVGILAGWMLRARYESGDLNLLGRRRDDDTPIA